jgi:restriction endonuclease S subunit
MKQTTQFKNTAIGKIPIDWEVKKLRELGDTFSGLSGKNKEDFGKGYPYIPYKNIFQNSKIDINFMDYVDIKESEKQHKVKYGDIFFTTSSETVEEVGMSSVLLDEVDIMYLNSFCFGFRLKNNNVLDPLFSSYLLRGENIRKELNVLAQGSTRFNLSKSELIKLIIPIPPLLEQQKIAKVLSTWDKAIQETNLTIKKLKKRNKALANKLFLDNNKKPNQKQIMQIVDRIKNSFTPEENTLYKQIGIRSHAKGLFYKEAVTGESLGNKSVFWIEPNCFIVNIVFAWERAIGKTTDAEIGFIASHRFPMYRPKEGILNLDYLLYFFKSPKGKYLLELASPGGAGRNKTLGQTEFLKLKIPVPSMDEQIRLVDVLDTATKELQHYQQKLSNLKLQKKGLMQQLLTGKVRTV